MNKPNSRPVFAYALFAIWAATLAVADPVITKDGESFPVSSDGQLGVANEFRISSRAQVAGGRLRQTEWWISKAVIERQPHWDALTAEPPLSVHQACSIALPAIKERFPAVHDWLVDTVYVRNLIYATKPDGSLASYPNTWAYEITFIPADKKARENFQNAVDVGSLTEVVLFDRTLVQPRTKQ
jgi:hypothetical protein